MNCVCGHPEKDHVRGGKCRVPDCPCELFRPGDTLGVRAWPGATAPACTREGVWTTGPLHS
jgi:hypothetical protein